MASPSLAFHLLGAPSRSGARRALLVEAGAPIHASPISVQWLPDEIAVRLHHRLTQIHPFPNGNGRHARMMADLLVQRLGGQPFSWSGGGLADVGELRVRYVTALKAADDHDIGPSLAFVRS